MKTWLPPEFVDLEQFADRWCLATETERHARRLASSMSELQAFYDALFPRLEEAIEYCDKHALNELPDDVSNLLLMIYSLINVAMAVEIFHQPRTIDAADAVLTRVRDPRP
jgi:hypothetical protein